MLRSLLRFASEIWYGTDRWAPAEDYMRYPIRIATFWQPLFRLFGFAPQRSHVEIKDDALVIHFGTASETIPLNEVGEVEPRSWPAYYGLGPKLGPDGEVAYVGSTEGVLRIKLKTPRPLNVWGPFRRSAARSVTVSLEDPQGFLDALREATAATGTRSNQ